MLEAANCLLYIIFLIIVCSTAGGKWKEKANVGKENIPVILELVNGINQFSDTSRLLDV